MRLLKCCTQYVSRFGKQQFPQDWKRSVFIPIPRKGSAKECSNYHIIVLISHASKVCSISFRLGFSSTWTKNIHCLRSVSNRQRNQRSNCQHFWILKKAKEFQKKTYFCFIDSAKGFDCVDHRELWNILKEMWVPDHLICLLRNPYTGHRAN